MPTTDQSASAASEVLFGVTIRDEYRWLEDAKAPRVQEWMSTHDAAARSFLSGLPSRSELKARLSELVYVEQRTIPQRKGSRYFYSIKPKDREKAIYYVREGKHGAERVLLDPNTMSADGSLSIGGQSPSHDGKLVAYLEHPKNADEATLRILDVTSGNHLADEIPGLRYTGASWLPDASGFYYTWMPPDQNLPVDERVARSEVRFHRLGTQVSADHVEFPATLDPSKHLDGWASKDGEVLFVQVGRGWSQNDLYVRRTRDAAAPFTVMARDIQATFSATKFKNTLYITTNEGAPRFRVFRTSLETPERAAWQELIPEDAEAVLDDVRIVGGHLVLNYLHNAHSEVQIRTLEGKLVRKVQLPGIGTASSFVGNDDSDEAYYSFSSFVHPSEIFETSIAKGGTKLFARVAVPVDFSQYATQQEWFRSKDGTRVPMFIIHPKKLVRDGSSPALMTAYGGFAASLLPEFNASLFAWLERGGIVAIPNLRGGGEFGEGWHAAGMLANKQNVFDDFAAAAEYLISEKYTSASHLGIVGRSNGGLLVGAALTQRPELFGAVICGVPLLDMLRYHKFGLGKTWVPEYGNPELAADFQWLARYSPYHQLKAGVAYPPLLMTSADTDDRVDPMHARKFVAALEALEQPPSAPRVPASDQQTSKTWLRIERNSGHGGADLRRSYIERAADEYAFLLNALR